LIVLYYYFYVKFTKPNSNRNSNLALLQNKFSISYTTTVKNEVYNKINNDARTRTIAPLIFLEYINKPVLYVYFSNLIFKREEKDFVVDELKQLENEAKIDEYDDGKKTKYSEYAKFDKEFYNNLDPRELDEILNLATSGEDISDKMKLNFTSNFA
jgi:hypothetical protein